MARLCKAGWVPACVGTSQDLSSHGRVLAAELMEGPVGYDMSHAVWHNAGWQEMKDLRKKLENLKELRELIKKLGRASGKGPKRRAPQEARHHSPHQLAALHVL